MKEMSQLEKHYNKFNEDKRLTRRHGQVEYITAMKYIHEYLEMIEQGYNNNNDNNNNNSGYACENKILKKDIKIIDIGAGTGRYSIALHEEGYDVTAVELVKYNLGIMKSKCKGLKAYQGNALRLKKIESDTYDLTILFGPMYHLYTKEDKVKALREAMRVTKKGGIIMVAYLMNEYSVITYGFKENNAKQCVKDGRYTEDFACKTKPEDLYDYVRIEHIDEINREAGIERIKIISADGPADYLRPILNKMDDGTFELFMKYHLSTCERMDLIGAGAHTIDVLRNICNLS